MTTMNGPREEGARRWLAALALLGLSTLAGACDRTHLGSAYGQSFNAWFAMQHVRSTPNDSEATKHALGSLDAQEATAISKSYRRTVGGQTRRAGAGADADDRAGPHGRRGSYTPPPSVPQGQ